MRITTILFLICTLLSVLTVYESISDTMYNWSEARIIFVNYNSYICILIGYTSIMILKKFENIANKEDTYEGI